MSVTEGWNHKDEWRRNGRGFMVSVSRHHVDSGDDANRWCVYAYVYPKHRIFETLDKSNDAGILASCCGLSCHSYVSLYKVHRSESGDVMSVQIGWDYNHDGDDRFFRYATPDGASSVFWDAGQLFTQLEEMNRESTEVS